MIEYQIDPVLARFYGVDSVAGLVTAMEENILKLQDLANRNVKPWEDTFPPTLLPKHIRDQGALLNKDALALAQSWEDRAAESWDEDPAHAAMQTCCDELRDLVNGATQPAGDVA